MKLQELLTKHYKEYTTDERDDLVEVEVNKDGLDDERIIYKLYGKKLGEHHYFTCLSYILFSTPFLSLLEWNDGIEYSELMIKYKGATATFTNNHKYQTHKINLALMPDEGRVEYIEKNTI